MEIVKGKRTKRPRPFSPDISVNTEEEEEDDMANCLILLAQGHSPNQEREDDKEESSKTKLIETISISTGSTTGVYIYECKTCNRTFQSFQALGGHRASHKRPRTDPKEDKDVKKAEVKGQLGNSSLPIHVHPVAVTPLSIKASKVHECSICGSEFSSGQALGGHMRRHRVAPLMKAPPCAAGESEEEEEETHDHKTINILSFDLNLPAPVEDDQNQVVDSTFGFRPENRLVFSGPALVGCHY